MVLVILLDVEVDGTIALVGIAIVEDFLNQFLCSMIWPVA